MQTTLEPQATGHAQRAWEKISEYLDESIGSVALELACYYEKDGFKLAYALWIKIREQKGKGYTNNLKAPLRDHRGGIDFLADLEQHELTGGKK